MPPDPPVITLTTDFGISDHYVGVMKGAILSVNPDATIVDITHEIQPQRVEEGAFLLEAAWPYFPPGSIHVAVVDPGVGTERRALALSTPAGIFVGPDNGVLSAALPASARPRGSRPLARPVQLPDRYTAVAIENCRFMRQPVSATFHGRDVFAPAAAHLSLGVSVDRLGASVASMLALPPFRGVHRSDGSVGGRVVHIDQFGNLVTSIRAADVPKGKFTLEVAGVSIHGMAKTYGAGDEPVALIGSSGYLEIAFPLGSAEQALDAELDMRVSLRPVVVRLKKST